ncbi:MAG: hypothetical protein RLY20_2873 [Verrucomicrobiota bacterium]
MRSRRWQRVLLALGIGVFAANGLVAQSVRVELQTAKTWHFTNPDVWFSNEFPGARLNECTQTGSNEFTIAVSPENRPINPSAWYAFKVWSDAKRELHLVLTNTYDGRLHRARLSNDGKNWDQIAKARYTAEPSNRVMRLQIKVGRKPTWVAAQEMIGISELEAWMDAKCRLPFALSNIVGTTIEGRPIREFTLSESTNANFVFIISRQHPPEVTGSVGMMSYVDTIAGSSRLAKQFRRQFQTVVVPLVNPDGVEHGHWRHNLGGVDLNRDWQEFSQPETRAVSSFLAQTGRQPGALPFLFVDFHSTSSNVFYTQPDGQWMKPYDFARRWLERTTQRDAGFKIWRDAGHNVGLATSKAWANETFQIPAITCEFGSSTDRDEIRRFSRIAAEEMMRLLLAELEHPFVPPAATATSPVEVKGD